MCISPLCPVEGNTKPPRRRCGVCSSDFNGLPPRQRRVRLMSLPWVLGGLFFISPLPGGETCLSSPPTTGETEKGNTKPPKTYVWCGFHAFPGPPPTRRNRLNQSPSSHRHRPLFQSSAYLRSFAASPRSCGGKRHFVRADGACSTQVVVGPLFPKPRLRRGLGKSGPPRPSSHRRVRSSTRRFFLPFWGFHTVVETAFAPPTGEGRNRKIQIPPKPLRP